MATRKRHTPEQVVRKLAQADRMLGEGKDVADVCRELQVSEQTYYRWRNQFGGLKADDGKRLKDLEKENSTLKRLLADAELEKAALKEIARETSEPERRRAAVAHLIRVMGVSERFACRVTGQSRTAQRRPPAASTTDDPDAARRGWLRAWATNHPRRGFRDACHDARGESWHVNHKKIQRLWREEGLRVPQKRRRKRLGTSTTPNLPVATGDDLTNEPDRVAAVRGYPAVLRCDNGTELACVAMAAGPANEPACISSRPASRGATATPSRSAPASATSAWTSASSGAWFRPAS